MRLNSAQIWDFATAEKIKDVPQDIQNTSQVWTVARFHWTFWFETSAVAAKYLDT